MQPMHHDPASPYWIADIDPLLSPSLIVFRDLVEQNLATMVQMAGDPDRLRPHCKTHKMPRVIALELQRGIGKHKAATFAEAEMLARADVLDVLLAYNIVGPNIPRITRYREAFPKVRFAVTADHTEPVERLAKEMSRAGTTVEVLLDLDTGQHRTGLPIGTAAGQLYRQIAEAPGLQAGGLHVYDGHQKQPELEKRRSAVRDEMQRVFAFRDELSAAGLPVPRLVCGGTVSFPIYAEMEDPAIELSPGTCTFFDIGYQTAFADLPFQPAAAVLTRVISQVAANRVTLDLGYKAVAADPPVSSRVVFPDLVDAKLVLQNEEHLVVETALATQLTPGTPLLAIPWHICPTVALHRAALVVKAGEVIEEWEVAARDRKLSI